MAGSPLHGRQIDRRVPPDPQAFFRLPFQNPLGPGQEFVRPLTNALNNAEW